MNNLDFVLTGDLVLRNSTEELGALPLNLSFSAPDFDSSEAIPIISFQSRVLFQILYINVYTASECMICNGV
jgi:hypothetical protein